MIPFIDLRTQYQSLKPAVQSRIDRVLEHGQYIMGPEVAELEARLAEYTGTRHCITVASGTEALLITLMALGVGPGDEVITTPFTFIATAEVIALLGATPVFIDVEAETCNLDPALLEAAITPRTKAIIPVSLYGQPADMDEINAIAFRHGSIPVIEDAAQSFGAEYKGRKSCSLSTVGCTSFFPSKPLGCYGDGGALFTDDGEIARVAREIRVHGQEKRYVHTRVGVGGRMDTLQCAILLAKFDRFPWEVEQRVLLGARYQELFDGRVRYPLVRPDRTSVFAQFTIMVDDREAVQEHLKLSGVPTAVHYPIPIHRQPGYKQFAPPHPLPQADWLASRVISLPMSPDLQTVDMDRIVKAVLEAPGIKG